MKINFKLNTEPEIPDKFFNLLKSHPNEFNYLLNSKIKSTTIELYEIEDEETDIVMGYFYLDKKKEGYYFSVIIEPDFRGKKLGKNSLSKAKEILRNKDINTMFAQVNRKTEEGIKVRRWLLREGFKIVRDNSLFWAKIPDAEYIEKNSKPIEFYLNL